MPDGLVPVPVLTVPRKRWSATVRNRRLKAFDGKCAMCKVEIGPHTGLDFDHCLPLALGGEDVESNLQPLCKRCHTTKTVADIRAIRKADRARHRHQGTEAPSAKPIRSGQTLPGASPKRRATSPLMKEMPPRRGLYVEGGGR